MNFEKRENNETYEENFSWENDITNVDRAVAMVEKKLGELGWPEDQIYSFSVAVDEALANAILHGNLGVDKKDGEDGYAERITAAQQVEENKAKRVEVFFRFTPEEAFARIKDAGSFVPEAIVDPTAEGKLLQGSGRGLPLIAMQVDDLQFSPGEISFRKRRNDNQDAI